MTRRSAFFQQWLAAVSRCGAALAFIVALAPHAGAQPSAAVPENARVRAYGGGWTCEYGFREERGGCAAIAVPANAHSNAELEASNACLDGNDIVLILPKPNPLTDCGLPSMSDGPISIGLKGPAARDAAVLGDHQAIDVRRQEERGAGTRRLWGRDGRIRRRRRGAETQRLAVAATAAALQTAPRWPEP